jgi:phosphatidylglycerol---prolipoprotein diacylglyceryl transferase
MIFMFYHNISPVFLSIGPLEIRYYGLIYALGFILTLFFLKKYSQAKKLFKNKEHPETLIFYLIIGVVIFARLFEVLFYNPSHYFTNPIEILKIWNGGLSFHGGITGAAIAVWIFAKKYKYSFLKIADLISIPAALALALGRIANFINGELYGRLTSVPWAVKFPNIDGFRHPSQLYESAKNFIIFFTLLIYNRKQRNPGVIFSLFLILYSVFRFRLEYFREPEVYIGFLTMGQALSIPLFIIGITLFVKKVNQPSSQVD